MDFSIMVYAVIALVGVAIGWLFASYQHAQQKAEQLAEREEMVAELSAAKQQITQSEHWRAECELLNNEVRSLQSINTSLSIRHNGKNSITLRCGDHEDAGSQS